MKIDRLLAITMLLLNRKRISAKELSERFEVSLRTVYRDVEAINQAGIPVVSYAGMSGGYEIMDQYRLDRQFLSLEELQSIIVGLKGIRSTVGDQEIGNLLDKVGALVAKSEQNTIANLNDQLIIDMNPWRGGNEDKEKLNTLRNAIRESKQISFQYISSQSEQSVRTAEPLSIVAKGFGWYLYGYCLLREDFRIFRLSRMKEIDVLSQTFERKTESIEKLGHGWGKRDPSSLIQLVLHAQPNVQAQVEDYFQSKQIAFQADGSMIITATQPDEPWLHGMLLSFGPSLRILEPAHLAAIIKEKAKKIVQLYASEH
ncbi:Predicted DNA-binding transcriptional regulator YafY, contains an HTH and WYL domains [Paenibacillus sp. yr247]|uniref:helix-turn-helix transcriptional regulator n=1 Tax=Paenibacillus sp. yr247 TaxID=1761880 RepID=UPI000887C132|nr:YafY family protein [Paenibacillus sp. yr247]SDO02161.1 Predicted DNA-binding transcriptional regulator YafY, contains an HTH and WYL domains [Paenibacillus sp. yr247]